MVRLIKAIISWLRTNWFIVGIAIVLLLAYANPEVGRKGGPLLPEVTVSVIAVGAIFFCSGVSLQPSQLRAAIKQVRLHVVVQGFSFIAIPLIINLIIVPLLYKLLVHDIAPSSTIAATPPTRELLSADDITTASIPAATIAVSPLPLLLQGLRLVSCMPPPVSSALLITKLIGGNDAASLFNCTLGSFLGIIITPMLLFVVVGTSASVPMTAIFVKLGATVVLPLLFGQAVRGMVDRQSSSAPTVATAAAASTASTSVASKRVAWSILDLPFSKINSILLLLIIYIAFCDTFLKKIQLSMTELLMIITIVALVQLILMITLAIISSWSPLGFTRADRVAIIFTGVHKSLTLGMPLVQIMFAGDSRLSLLTIPLLIYHPAQIIIGSLLVAPFQSWLQSSPAAVPAAVQLTPVTSQ